MVGLKKKGERKWRCWDHHHLSTCGISRGCKRAVTEREMTCQRKYLGCRRVGVVSGKKETNMMSGKSIAESHPGARGD
jgi:hypothetical protein